MKKIIGVIAEYNPFHLGHRYQIEKIKELYPDSIIIAIISTNFTQRGDISLLNKFYIYLYQPLEPSIIIMI